ncbi:MAG: hypothetical protein L3V56_01785 [Candidatus Magnetoovum sp. WYHC-5]|nr:hypothetical protein [Candidatus Magnetoovum sp. WYHC-5]
MSQILFYSIIILGCFVAIGFVLARLYKRTTKEIAFVRTGLWGEKVIKDGGALVLPVLQQITKVNMNTIRLEVKRQSEQALITKDRMRVDVEVEFYVRVKPTEEAIAMAAQTLGLKTLNPAELKELVEGKFVDALRAVAAEMTMEELHEKRSDFVQKVQNAANEDLSKNGLELESASLTGLDQTGKEFFNPQNAFDAQGLARLTAEIENRRRERNAIEQDTEVDIQRKNLEAERYKLEIKRDDEYARLEQEREIQIRRTAQETEIARNKYEKEREAKESDIFAKQEVEKKKIISERGIEEERIEKERLLKEKEIAREKSIKIASIDQQRSVELSEQNRLKEVQLAEQDRAIIIAQKSREQSTAETEANVAKANAEKSREAITTAIETEKANRFKQIELIEAAKMAEKAAISVTLSAKAEKEASIDRAEKIKIEAIAEAEAIKIRAAAKATDYEVEAKGKEAIHMAENKLSPEIIAMQLKLTLIKNLQGIINASVKPMEKIDSIKIIHVDGLGFSGGITPSDGGKPSENLAEQVVNSALRYRGQAPLVDALLKEIGVIGGDINAITNILSDKGKEKKIEEKERK